jgi:hypothetical protein
VCLTGKLTLYELSPSDPQARRAIFSAWRMRDMKRLSSEMSTTIITSVRTAKVAGTTRASLWTDSVNTWATGSRSSRFVSACVAIDADRAIAQ